MVVGAGNKTVCQLLQFRLVGEQDLGEESFVVRDLLGAVACGKAAHSEVGPGRIASNALGNTRFDTAAKVVLTVKTEFV